MLSIAIDCNNSGRVKNPFTIEMFSDVGSGFEVIVTAATETFSDVGSGFEVIIPSGTSMWVESNS